MKDETEHTCQFCYYEYFDGRLYPCSMCVNDNGDVWKATDREVLAWLPLPEPYREEVKAND